MSTENQAPDAFEAWLASPEYQAILLDDCETFNESDLRAAFAAGQKSGSLETAQKAFVEWLNELEAILIESQRQHAEALEFLRYANTAGFAEALGKMAGQVDIAREMIQTGLEAGV